MSHQRRHAPAASRLRAGQSLLFMAIAVLAIASLAHAQEPPDLLAEWPICDVTSAGAIAWHPDGYIVIAGSDQKVSVFGLDGSHVRSWGSSGIAPGQFQGLSGVAVGDGGNVFTSEEGGRRTQRFTVEGGPIGLWDSAYYPNDIAADGAGYFYLVTGGDDDMAKYAVDGTEITTWPCHPCFGVDADRQGHLYATSSREVLKFTTAGALLWAVSLDILPDDDPEAVVVAAGASGRVYVSDSGTQRTVVLSSDGTILKWWPGAVNGLAEDDQGRLYAAAGCSIKVYGFESTPVRPTTWGRLKLIYR